MRQSGILLHVTSLSGPEGIGTLGKSAFAFVDFLASSGCGVWQMLPVGPTGYGDSPYQSPSTFAGNPLLIDLETLEEQGLLKKGVFSPAQPTQAVDYFIVRRDKEKALEASFSYGYSKVRDEVAAFVAARPFVRPYAEYQALCEHFGWFYAWPLSARVYCADHNEETARLINTLSDRVLYNEYVQYLFDKQWNALKNYAHEHGVRLFGDMPIYVAPGSADVWMNPSLFQLDKELNETRVAGVPPDYFSRDGQLWGNPLYNWRAMRKDGYRWWIDRLRAMGERFDIVRIDHFIGFANYYSIPAGAKNARVGKWVRNRGKTLFKAIKSALPDLSIVAEDLGAVNGRVRRLLKFCGYPGMKVLVFGFSGDDKNQHRPQHIGENSIVYTGTHDNDTVLGWWNRIGEAERACAIRSLNMQAGDEICDAMVRAAFASKARMAVIPIQDLLCLQNDARMNIPGTIGGQNWRYRMLPTDLSGSLKQRLIILNRQYHRGNNS